MMVLSLQCSVGAPPTPSKCTILADQLPTLNYCFLPQRAAAKWSSVDTAQPAGHEDPSPVPRTTNQEPLLSLPFCLTLRSKPTLVPQ